MLFPDPIIVNGKFAADFSAITKLVLYGNVFCMIEETVEQLAKRAAAKIPVRNDFFIFDYF